MNSLSSQPFLKMCHIIPYSTGMSVPGRMRTYSVACAAVRVRRGSMTMTFALLSSLPSIRCCNDTGCASAGLPPMMIMRLGVADVVEAVGHRAVAPGIGHAGDGRRMADARLVVGVVGAPERRRACGTDRSLRWSSWPSRASRPSRAPDLLRISISLSPISLMAWSHLMRVHWPFTSFIGYFRRRSPMTSSRTEAPLAQCEPRLIGRIPARLLADPHAVRRLPP